MSLDSATKLRVLVMSIHPVLRPSQSRPTRKSALPAVSAAQYPVASTKASAERTMRDRFADELETHLRRAGLPMRRVPQQARLPRQTLFNWVRGTRPRWHPTLPDDLRRLGLALGLDEREIDRLLRLAGCLPASTMVRHTAEGTMQAAAALPEGWFLAGSHPRGYEVGVVPDAVGGHAAAYLRARAARDGFGTVMQQFRADSYRGQRLRLSALVRSETVEQWAGLWMRVDGIGRGSLAFDNMRDRAITGTTDWDAARRGARCGGA